MTLAALCALGTLPAMIPQKAEAAMSVSFNFFFDELEPHGRWVYHERYGRCWEPLDVYDGWRPYADGYWEYTDYGWTWVTDEPWGWATYHYGRWVHVGRDRWLWVPGYEWGPAWVSWRYSDRYVGWAPLPPEADCRRDTGLGVWVDVRFNIGADRYNFCDTRHFGSRNLRRSLYRPEQNVTIINNTVNVTQINYVNNSTTVFNGGPDLERVNRRSERRLERLQLARRDDPTFNGGERRARRNANRLEVFAPDVTKQAVVPQGAAPSERVRRRDRISRAEEPRELTQTERNLQQSRHASEEQRPQVADDRQRGRRIDRRREQLEASPPELTQIERNIQQSRHASEEQKRAVAEREQEIERANVRAQRQRDLQQAEEGRRIERRNEQQQAERNARVERQRAQQQQQAERIAQRQRQQEQQQAEQSRQFERQRVQQRQHEAEQSRRFERQRLQQQQAQPRIERQQRQQRQEQPRIERRERPQRQEMSQPQPQPQRQERQQRREAPPQVAAPQQQQQPSPQPERGNPESFRKEKRRDG